MLQLIYNTYHKSVYWCAPQLVPTQMSYADFLADFPLVLRATINIVALGLLYFFAVRPLLQWINMIEARPEHPRRMLHVGPQEVAGPQARPAGIDARLGFPQSEKTPQEREFDEARKIYDQVAEYIASNPEKTADLLRAWMKD